MVCSVAAVGFKIIVRSIAESCLIDSGLNAWLANCYVVRERVSPRQSNDVNKALEQENVRSGSRREAYFLSAHDGGTKVNWLWLFELRHM